MDFIAPLSCGKTVDAWCMFEEVRPGLGWFSIFNVILRFNDSAPGTALMGIVPWLRKTMSIPFHLLTVQSFFGCNNRLLEMLKPTAVVVVIIVVLDEFGLGVCRCEIGPLGWSVSRDCLGAVNVRQSNCGEQLISANEKLRLLKMCPCL